jgi:hypothetical protein
MKVGGRLVAKEEGRYLVKLFIWGIGGVTW